MTKRTTIDRLRRVREMRMANLAGEPWLVNPNRHPEPKIPTIDHLENGYLHELSVTSPHLVDEAKELIKFISTCKERR